MLNEKGLDTQISLLFTQGYNSDIDTHLTSHGRKGPFSYIVSMCINTHKQAQERLFLEKKEAIKQCRKQYNSFFFLFILISHNIF